MKVKPHYCGPNPPNRPYSSESDVKLSPAINPTIRPSTTDLVTLQMMEDSTCATSAHHLITVVHSYLPTGNVTTKGHLFTWIGTLTSTEVLPRARNAHHLITMVSVRPISSLQHRSTKEWLNSRIGTDHRQRYWHQYCQYRLIYPQVPQMHNTSLPWPWVKQ